MKMRGYTLLEVLFVLAVFAILSLYSVSSVVGLTTKNEQQVIEDNIRTIVQYARIQSLTKGITLYLYPLNAADWSNGIVLTKMGKDTDNKIELLHQWQWALRHWTVQWSGARSSNRIAISPNPEHAISNGTFTLINSKTKQEVILTLNRLGRVRLHSA